MKKSKLLFLAGLASVMAAGLAACNSASSPESITGSTETSEQASSEISTPAETSTPASSSEGCAHTNLEHHDAVEPGCDDGGNLEYYYCPDCQTYYDKDMNEADYADLLLDPAHDLFKHDAVPGREESSAEYYECSKCHRYFNDDEASLEYEEGEWITEGYAIHWQKGEQMTTRAVNECKLADLEGKGFAFDFKFVEEGTNFICFGQTLSYTWNVTQTLHLTYAGGVYTTDRGVVTEPDEDGWATCIINRNEFAGDGMDLYGADAIDVVFGGWVGVTDSAGAEWYLDGTSCRIVEEHADIAHQWKTGKDVNIDILPTVTVADVTEGKVLAFDVKFEDDSTDAFAALSIYNKSWAQIVVADVGVYQTADGLKVCNWHDHNEQKGIAGEKTADGVVTVYIDPSYFNTDNCGDIVGWAYLWDSSKASVDAKSFRIEADPEAAKVKGTYCKAGEAVSINLAKLVTKEELQGNTVEFDFKFMGDGQVTLKMYDATGDWMNISGAFTLKCEEGTVSADRGTVTAIANGYYTFALPFADFNGSKLETAAGFSLLYSDGNTPTVDMYIDFEGVRVVSTRNLKTGADVNLDIVPTVATADLTGDKQLAFDVVFDGANDGNVQFSLYKGSWGSIVIADVKVEQKDGAITVTQRHDGTTLGTAGTRAENGVVTCYIPAEKLDTKIDTINWGYLWTSSNASLDIASFRAEEDPNMREWLTGNDTNLAFTNSVAFADVTEGKAFAYDVKFEDDSDAYIEISFYEGVWSKDALRDVRVEQKDGAITVTHRHEGYVMGNTFEKKSNGVVTVYLTSDQFYRDADATSIGWGYIWASSKASVDIKSLKVVDVPSTRTWKTGNDTNLDFTNAVPYSEITEGKAFAFDVKFDDDTEGAYIAVSFYEGCWSKIAIGDVKVTQTADGYTVTNRNNGATLGAASAKDADGIVTVYCTSAVLETKENATSIGWGYIWNASNASIDIQSLRVVDVPATRTWKTGNDINLDFTNAVSYSDVTEGKAVAFDVKFDDDTEGAYIAVSFYEGCWSKIAIGDVKVTQTADGYTVTNRNNGDPLGTASAKGADGIVTVYCTSAVLETKENAESIGWGYIWNSSKASIDIQSLRVEDAPATRTWMTGNDTNLAFTNSVSYSDVTEGKAVAFDVKFDDDTEGAYIAVSFYQGSWNKLALGDVKVTQTADGYTVTNRHSGDPLGTASAKGADGIVTVYCTSAALNTTEGAESLGWGYIWESTKASIDIQSLRVVDIAE